MDTPASIDQALQQATLLYTQQRYAEADALCHRILTENSHHAETLNLAGLLAIIRRDYHFAESLFRQALAIRPDLDCLYNNLGIALFRQGRLSEALEFYRIVALRTPHEPAAQSNVAYTLQRMGRVEEAIEHYQNALKINPQHEKTHSNYALALLLAGRYSEGWAEYEYRSIPILKKYPQPVWADESLSDTTIVVHTEQGFGDTIQFVRYLPMLHDRGASIILHGSPELYRLLSHHGDYQVIRHGDPLPAFDLQCGLLSLPHRFGTILDTIPRAMSYLNAERDGACQWQKRMTPYRGMKVGLVWAGNPKNTEDAERSISFDLLQPLLDVRNITFFSLQKKLALPQTQTLPLSVQWVDWTSELSDFADTAALIANLDLVIAVDTAVAHLAAALGRPVWTMLEYSPDFRWLLHREDTPWYPTMRLFRQSQHGDWPAVIQKVAAELHKAVWSFHA